MWIHMCSCQQCWGGPAKASAKSTELYATTSCTNQCAQWWFMYVHAKRMPRWVSLLHNLVAQNKKRAGKDELNQCCFCLVFPNRTRREGRHHCLFLSCRWGVCPPSCLWGVVLCFSNRCDWVYRVVPSVVSPIMLMGCGIVCFPS